MWQQNDKETLSSGFAVNSWSRVRYDIILYIQQTEIDPVGYVNIN